VITHDLASGCDWLALAAAFVGIVCLQPDHRSPDFVLKVVAAIESAIRDTHPPFVLVLSVGRKSSAFDSEPRRPGKATGDHGSA
jgi:hypothetical protein